SLLALLALVIPCLAQEATSGNKLIEGWGTTLNPAEDCEFKVENQKLRITVPGSADPHDLSAELRSAMAPRVLQPVSGDFTIQVKIEGEFQPGDQSSERLRSGYTGAGLVVFADNANFVRIERATLHHQGDEAVPYTNFEIRVDGELQEIGTTADLPTEKGKPTWLKLERKGDQLLGAMSQDGEHWTYGKPKTLNSKAWKQNPIVAGIAAISTSRLPFYPIYSEFSIRQGSKADAEKNALK
ncbi:MAG: hypothetical protein JWL90_688, partial [Chthoniobacteraceae bacterium]|nr:hypothetical protein [Chthoniobacteraceae bacterium]